MFKKLHNHLVKKLNGPLLRMSSALSTEPSTSHAFLTLSISELTSSDVGLSCGLSLDEAWSDVVEPADAKSAGCVSPAEVCDVFSSMPVQHSGMAIGSSKNGRDVLSHKRSKRFAVRFMPSISCDIVTALKML